MRTLGISVVTDMCLPDALEPASISDIIATANKAEKKLRRIVVRIIKESTTKLNGGYKKD